MRPIANILERGDISPFLNATSEVIYLKKRNSYIKVPQAKVKLIPKLETKEIELNGVAVVVEEPKGIVASKDNSDYNRKIFIVPETVFYLPHGILKRLRQELGIVGVAIPEVYVYENGKFFVEVLKVKFF